MALRASERGKMPATRDGLAKTPSAARATAVAARAIPLRLASLLQPYRKEGRLSLRVERMQQLGTYSRDLTPQQTEEFIRNEEKLWAPIVRQVEAEAK